MLKHEENSETLARPAAQVRVTPEELAQALSRIEARKDAGQRNVDGTISIGEAVQQLGVDATPEEVLAEVQAIRQEPMRTRKRRPTAAQRSILALGLGGVMLGLALDVNGLQQMQAPQAAGATNISSPQPISLDPNLRVGDASGKIVMLSEVGDSQPMHCILENNSDGERFDSYRPGYASEYVWTLVKHHGQVYVRGWTLRMSNKVVLTNGADVSAQASDSQFVAPISLPLNGFLVYPGAGSAAEFSAVNIHLDKHAYEKWKP